MTAAHYRDSVVTNTLGFYKPVPSASVLVRAPGTQTPVTCYADPLLTILLAQPLAVDANGVLEFYLPIPRYVDLVVSGAGVTTATLANTYVPDADVVDRAGQVFNVSAYGQLGTANDSATFMLAINAAKAVPGGVVLVPAGSFNVLLNVVNAAAGQGVTIRGAGARVTTLVGLSAATDILVMGQTNAERGDNLVLEDIGFSGGRYQLRLNNCLGCTFRRLFFSGGTSAIYTEGQNEKHQFEQIYCSAQSGNAIDIGNANGGNGSVALDNPEMQKCTWANVEVAGCGGLYAIRQDAGIINAAQQTSGFNLWQNVRIVSHRQHGFYVAHSSNTLWQVLNTEGIARNGANQFTDLWFDVGNGLGLIGQGVNLAVDAGNPLVQYYVNVVTGWVTMIGLVTGSLAAQTADVRNNDHLTLIESALVGGAATGVQLAGVGGANFTPINVRDSSGNPIFSSGGSSPNPAPAPITGGTLPQNYREYRANPAAPITGVIIAPGFYTGQTLTVVNIAAAANSITFAAVGTSNVAGGASTVIAGSASRTFIWDVQALLWI